MYINYKHCQGKANLVNNTYLHHIVYLTLYLSCLYLYLPRDQHYNTSKL